MLGRREEELGGLACGNGDIDFERVPVGTQ